MCGNALAYCDVSMLRAAFDAGYARVIRVDSRRAGSVVTASEPIPLETLTMTGLLGALEQRQEGARDAHDAVDVRVEDAMYVGGGGVGDGHVVPGDAGVVDEHVEQAAPCR